MRLVHVAGVLAIALVFVVTPYGPAGAPPAAREDVANATTVVLVDGYRTSPAPLIASGGTVIADYHNGYVLMRIPTSVEEGLRGERGIDALPGRTMIDMYYSGVRFDSALGTPVLPPELQARSPGVYLVQFAGPIMSEWVLELEAYGFTFDQYLASYAFVARGTPQAVSWARSLPYVQWVGTYEPGYKVASKLLTTPGVQLVSIQGLPDASLDSLLSHVDGTGAQLSLAWDTPPTAIAYVTAAQIPALAQDPDVLAIQPYTVPVALDKIAGQIHGFASAWSTQRSGLPSTLTGRSPGPDGTMYNGDDQYEGAGIEDTGFDEGDPNAGPNDFFASPNGDRVTRFVDHTGFSTRDGQYGGSAHGTHVAGIIGSDGYSWESWLIENQGDTTVSTTDHDWSKSEAGVAPESKISVDGIQAFGGGLQASSNYWDCQYLNGYITTTITTVTQAYCGNPWTDGTNVATHNAAIDAGSRTFFTVETNSWGSGAGGYGPTASAADARMNAAPDRIIVFAAGNGGPSLNTVSTEALLKNGLSIGASDNFRPDQFESDNPNLIAGFSSRGGPGQSLGRIKPDLLAIGTSVASLFARGETLNAQYVPGQAGLIGYVDKYCSLAKAFCSAGDGIADYRYLQGTSMAAPMAAGMAMLTREYLREVAAANDPASPYYNPPNYLVKAILVNGAVRMDPNLYEYPGYDQGWGRIDLEQSLFPPVPRTNQFTTGTLATTGTCDLGAGTCTGAGNTIGKSLNLYVAKPDVPLKVTLTWLDAAGDFLSRDLNLRVLAPDGTEYHGDQYTNGWSDPTKTVYDNVNNVEQVEVQTPSQGTWQVQIVGFSVPSAAKFAIVVSADVGPQATYKVDLSTTYPTTVTLAPLGTATIPLTVLNYGTGADTIQLSSGAPAGLSVAYWPTNSLPLASGESQGVVAAISAGATVTPGVYEFDLRAASGTDPNPNPASDSVPVRVEVLNFGLPYSLQVTNSTVDELDPSVLTFTDAAVGGSHIFIVYRKTSAVTGGGLTGGVNVWLAHAMLDPATGLPVLPFAQSLVSGVNDNPNDLRIIRLTAGNLKNRIIVTWTGSDPAETDPDAVSWSRIAYLDPGAAPYYQGTWTLGTIQKNEGTASPCNIARVSFPLFRAAPGISPNGQLIYVFEILAYASGCATQTAVVTSSKVSTDGGATWSAATQVFPPPSNTNFFFFPNGAVDQNDVAWVFAYWRTPTGNSRKLTVRLFDNGGWSTFPFNNYTILDTTDNSQWPAPLSTSEGAAGNRMYVTFTRDFLQTDLKMFLIYTDGVYSRTVLPYSVYDPAHMGLSCGTGCVISRSFAPVAQGGSGSGLKGPYGTSVSSANYNRRPILNIVHTDDGIVWLPHMENANPYSTPNLHTYYSGDGFGTTELTNLTADAYAKGHQMSDALSLGGTSRVYEVYHSSHGTVKQVNYEVYLVVYFANWPTAPDTMGPLVSGVAGTPNPVNRTQSFRLTANFNDVTTGNHNVTAAEYFVDTAGAPGTGTAMAATDGSWDSPTENAYADVNVSALGWGEGECHTIFVEGQDSVGNWGPLGSVRECTIRVITDPIPPIPPVLIAGALGGTQAHDVYVTWAKSTDEGAPGGTVKYHVFRATGIGGVYALVGQVNGTGAASYTFVDAGAGDGDPNLYLYKVRSLDAAGNEAESVQTAGKFTRPVLAGWNLVSVPVVMFDQSLGTVFQTLTWNRARVFVASDPADPWKAFIAGKAYNDLGSANMTTAVWVNSFAADSFTVAGLVPTGTPIVLLPGWNFVGFPSWRATPYTVGQLKAAVPAVTQVEGFDAMPPYYLQRLQDTDALLMGYGYWLWSTSLTPVTWTLP